MTQWPPLFFSPLQLNPMKELSIFFSPVPLCPLSIESTPTLILLLSLHQMCSCQVSNDLYIVKSNTQLIATLNLTCKQSGCSAFLLKTLFFFPSVGFLGSQNYDFSSYVNEAKLAGTSYSLCFLHCIVAPIQLHVFKYHLYANDRQPNIHLWPICLLWISFSIVYLWLSTRHLGLNR